MPPPMSAGHHRMPPRQVPSTVPSTHRQRLHSVPLCQPAVTLPSATRADVPVPHCYPQCRTGSVLTTGSACTAVGAVSTPHPAQVLFAGMPPIHELWEAVHVPCLMFAKTVICLPHSTRAWLEGWQRQVGCVALGCHWQCFCHYPMLITLLPHLIGYKRLLLISALSYKRFK